MTRSSNPALMLALPLLLSACATQDLTHMRTVPHRNTTSIDAAKTEEAERKTAEVVRLFKGTGVLVKGQLPGGGLPAGATAVPGGGGVVLNFEGADLREVVRNILGDILGESYTIDPSVGGQVTIRTSTGIPRESLPATLETLLRMNGATMVKEAGIYKVVPQAAAVRGNTTPQLGNSTRSLPAGFSVQIVPLRYVGVREMLRLLEPFARDAQAVRVDELRNLLILSGTERELANLMEAIALFDIDWMAGMSAGVFVLQSADVKSVMQELEKALGDRNTSPLTGILRIVPIERMNALLVITPQPAYLEEAKKWIARLDQGGGGDGPRFFVYNLQNQRADKLGPLLQQAFTGRQQQQAAPTAPTVSPGTPAGQIVSPPQFGQPFNPGVTPTPPPPPTASATATASSTPPPGPVTPGGPNVVGRGGADGLGIVRNIQVVADKDNNTLLIVATQQEYQIIEAAIKKLDQPSRQVMMEVTIAEVSLKDQFEFGVEWLFKGGAPSGRGTGGLLINSTPFDPGVAAPIGTTGEGAAGLALRNGFSYIIRNSNFLGGVQALLQMLDTYGNIKVIANPHLAALDNQKATIKAGDRIPVSQQTLVGGTSNAVTTTSQYIDTGVLLQVTPHINAGGLVTLDVQAEVSNPGTAASPGEAPPINTRSVQTIISVQSGQTMVMGGLINETKSNQSTGLPLLARIPILGGLFGQQTLVDNRTELVVFITPRLVDNEFDMKGVMNDLRRRMERLDNLFPPNVGPDGSRAPVMTPWSLGDPVPLHPPVILIPPPQPPPVNSNR